MTTEEAINRLEYVYDACRFCLDDCGFYGDCERCKKAIDMAIKALKYKEPKKPVFDETQSWIELRAIYVCPTCGLVYDKRDKPKFCPECGQKIDWSNKNG